MSWYALRHAIYRVTDVDRAKAFYTGVLGLPRSFESEGVTYFQVSERQYVGIQAGWDGKSDRFVRLALEVEQDTAVETFTDPDGHAIDFIWPRSRRPFSPAKRVSDRMTHAGISVADEGKAMTFWRDKLGSREIWRGGRDEQTINWINMQLDGGSGDYIELMLTRGQQPSLGSLGSMHHICLETNDIQATWAELKRRGVPDEERHRPRIGRNKRWLLNLFDPDGTRTEFMEPRLAV